MKKNVSITVELRGIHQTSVQPIRTHPTNHENPEVAWGKSRIQGSPGTLVF